MLQKSKLNSVDESYHPVACSFSILLDFGGFCSVLFPLIFVFLLLFPFNICFSIAVSFNICFSTAVSFNIFLLLFPLIFVFFCCCFSTSVSFNVFCFALTTVFTGAWAWWWELNWWWTSRVANLPRRLQRSSATSQCPYFSLPWLASCGMVTLTVFSFVPSTRADSSSLLLHHIISSVPPTPWSPHKHHEPWHVWGANGLLCCVCLLTGNDIETISMCGHKIGLSSQPIRV